MSIWKFVGAAVVAMGVSGAAGAATLDCATSGKKPVSFALSSAVDVTCVSRKNDTNTVTSSYSLFGQTGWTLADKSDDGVAGSPISFLDAPEGGKKRGTWSVADWAGLEQVVITLKAGRGFAAFLVDVSEGLTGRWASGKNLSHASIYYRNGDTNPTPIPLPATALLMLAGLGGLGVVARARSAR